MRPGGGTAPLRRIDILRNGTEIVDTHSCTGTQVTFAWTDPATAGRGSLSSYVRVEQEDGQLAWSSPIWVLRPLRKRDTR